MRRWYSSTSSMRWPSSIARHAVASRSCSGSYWLMRQFSGADRRRQGDLDTTGYCQCPRYSSMKIVGRHRAEAIAERPEPLGAHRHHVVLVLEGALDEQERLVDEGQPVAMEQRR